MQRSAPCLSSSATGSAFGERRRRLWPLPLLVLLLCLSCLCAPACAQAPRISDYTPLFRPGSDSSGRKLVAIRSFSSNGVPHLLAVDPITLQSVVLPASSWRGSATDRRLASTPFVKALDRYSAAPYRLQNQGATHAEQRTDGIYLTVDLCPSRRRFERELFEIAERMGEGKPVPVAVCVSGVWLASHPDELSYLKREAAQGRLAITWVNHSYHHFYDPKLPLSRNFVLKSGTDFDKEVLDLEQLLLAEGLTPSPFFRFPGLVSDAAAVKRLRELSLIPIGSDAWLAKGEQPKPGSFILVHGNGNEPKGVQLLLPMLTSGDLHLRPLPEAFR